jgi:hypothetical protein
VLSLKTETKIRVEYFTRVAQWIRVHAYEAYDASSNLALGAKFMRKQITTKQELEKHLQDADISEEHKSIIRAIFDKGWQSPGCGLESASALSALVDQLPDDMKITCDGCKSN